MAYAQGVTRRYVLLYLSTLIIAAVSNQLTRPTLKTLLVKSVRNSLFCGSCLSEGLKPRPVSITSATSVVLIDFFKPKLGFPEGHDGVVGLEGVKTLLLLLLRLNPEFWEYELDVFFVTLTWFICLILNVLCWFQHVLCWRLKI